MTGVRTPEPSGLFVYGTLRPDGGRLHGMLPPGTVSLGVVATRARLWHVSALGGYPVLTVHDATGRDVVVGDLLAVDPWDAEAVTAMELGAGYDLRIIGLLDGRRAWAYVWPDDDHGAHIASGDWFDRWADRQVAAARRRYGGDGGVSHPTGTLDSQVASTSEEDALWRP